MHAPQLFLKERSYGQELFACGIARSGAYNRTMTPFGFQAEERTIWQAPNTYQTMSPFNQAGLLSRGTQQTLPQILGSHFEMCAAG